ncbi:hypothetical protein [Leptolyngbya sp. FACHB-17]|uniref:hypothetical protein n=1 Tax=unclassified Leptolyngbya TaxID=2650499 RepID=UPI001681A3BB|nr:hypothetical protein [Leptolyngbya sp. FACHB-17]MBD2080947.1 hypothetical protein [Leptolyngbya sp. FACHB-17]
MGSNVFHVSAIATCPHQSGLISTIVSSPRVKVSSQPVATLKDQYLVAGCVFTVGPKPQPCVKVQWLVPATRVKVNGSPVILQNSVGLCKSVEEIPQGPPNIKVTQQRVKGV